MLKNIANQLHSEVCSDKHPDISQIVAKGGF
jgi:hypothetical protein